jgi:general secretion pathway protein K
MLKSFQNQRGMALLLVLLVITLLVAMVVEFDYWTRIDLRSAGNLRDGLQATYLAKGGVASAQALLKDDYRRNSNTTDLTGTWAIPLPPIPLGEGTVLLRITDESSKFNLNNLGNQPNLLQKKQTIIEAIELFRLAQVPPEIGEPIADAIADWVDTDNEPTGSFGAEESYYQSLPKPYHCKNKPMDSLSELHLVKGMTDDIYRKVSPYVTVASNGKININTAEPIVLQALGFDENAVKKLIDNRPFTKTSDLYNFMKQGELTQAYSRNQDLFTIKSDTFSVESRGKVHDVEKTVQSLLIRSGGIATIKTWRVE